MDYHLPNVDNCGHLANYQLPTKCTRSGTSKEICLPVLGYPTLSTNLMARIWNAVPGLQHASTLGAAKSLAKKWARDIPR